MNTISLSELKKISNPIIIDIRDNYSYNISHIKNSINIPYYNLLNNYSHYLNKNNTLFCRKHHAVNGKNNFPFTAWCLCE